MADRDIAVKFTGDTRDLERASDKAEKSVEGTGKSMGGALAGIAGPAAIAAGAVAGIAVVGWDLANAAAEDEAAAAQLAQQLHQAAGASDEAVEGAEKYIEALGQEEHGFAGAARGDDHHAGHGADRDVRVAVAVGVGGDGAEGEQGARGESVRA